MRWNALHRWCMRCFRNRSRACFQSFLQIDSGEDISLLFLFIYSVIKNNKKSLKKVKKTIAKDRK